MPNEKTFSEKIETGDKVPNDQTVTIRVAKAKQKVKGELKSQCQGGCGAYLTDDEKVSHVCPGPPPRRRSTKRLHKQKLEGKKILHSFRLRLLKKAVDTGDLPKLIARVKK